ncbi:MAG: glucosaminidase domain-containing protein [Desulfuromonadales bacterium]
MLHASSLTITFLKVTFSLLLGGALLGAAGCCEQTSNSHPLVGEPIIVSPDSYRDLQELFDSIGYDFGSIDQGVPRIIMTRLPDDMDQIDNITRKKRIFFLSLLPMVLMANEEIAYKRSRLKTIMESHETGALVTESEREWVRSLARDYRLGGDPLEQPELKNRLLRRVDIIPASLVLAQAANESGWGTSRFALAANNIFGEWTFIPGTGLVPKDRPEGAEYEVRTFDTLYQSLNSYIRNLNTHPAYRPLRSIRAQMRENGQAPNGVALARGLEKYSSRSDAYVNEIQQMIRQNDLINLSRVYLDGMNSN